MKKKYNDWVIEFPDRVVIRKEGFYYTCRDDSADIIATILNYRIGVNEKSGSHVTGSPSLEKLEDELKSHHISYVVIEHDEVVDKETFSDNQFREFINDEKWNEKIERLKNGKTSMRMDDDLLSIIDAFLEGINPFTGEIMRDDDILKSREMLAIYEAAKRDLLRNKKHAVPDRSSLNEDEVQEFEILRELRQRVAAEEHLPGYMVFKDSTLIEMIKHKPRDEEEMLAIPGVGDKKLEKYGDIFLEELSKM